MSRSLRSDRDATAHELDIGKSVCKVQQKKQISSRYQMAAQLNELNSKMSGGCGVAGCKRAGL